MGVGRFKSEETYIYIYLWLIHVVVWKKPTQYRKAIILQLNINVYKIKLKINLYCLWKAKKKGMKCPLPPAVVTGEQPPLKLHQWVHPCYPASLLCACLLESLTCLDCSFTHTPLHGKGNEGISTRCAHAQCMDVLGCSLVSAHLITQLLLSFRASHLWLGGSGLVLHCQLCFPLCELRVPSPGWVLPSVDCGKAPAPSREVC